MMRVLVADSQTVFRSILRQVFSEEGVDSFFCETAKEVLSKVHKGRVDLIILALTLKDMDGIELCRQLRAIPTLQHTPIIIFTAKDNIERLGEAFTAGVTDIYRRSDIENFTVYINRLLYFQRKIHGRVLIVEDTISQQEVLRATLEATGLKVTLFKEVNSALAAHVENPFDLIITDIVLDENSNGLDLVHYIRRLEGRAGDTPIIAVTAYASDSMRINLLARGVNCCIAKPVALAELEMQARNLVDPIQNSEIVQENKKLQKTNQESTQLLNALRKSETRLLLAQRTAHIGSWEINLENQKMIWSNEVFHIFGLDPDIRDMNYEDFLSYVHPDDRKQINDAYQESLIKKNKYDITHRIVLDNKDIKYVHVRSSSQYGKDQKTSSIIGTVQDVTEQMQAINELHEFKNKLEERVTQRTDELNESNLALEKANSAKSMFMANMSHEIRTPMNGVLGIAELLMLTPLNKKQMGYLQMIVDAGNDLVNIISEILDFSKIEAEKIELEYKPFNPIDLINSTVNPFEARLPPAITFSTKIDGNIPKQLLGDASRLKQILNNLINNALKFTHQGNISVQVELLPSLESDGTRKKSSAKISTEEKATLNFKVIDSGIGISDEKLESIFKPFSQADQSTTREYGGTGLGLTICKHFIDLMGGDINVDSELGKGSCFSFSISFDCDASLAATTLDNASAKPLPEIYAGIKILLVEDNPINQMVAQGLVSELGIEADVAENGQEAIDKVNSEHTPYDLIFMDCDMPLMDGYEATRQLRQREQEQALAPVPIYALTAHVLAGHEKRCRDAGMTGYVNKPIGLESIKKVFAQVFPLRGDPSSSKALKL